jgi:hypothetical protein
MDLNAATLEEGGGEAFRQRYPTSEDTDEGDFFGPDMRLLDAFCQSGNALGHLGFCEQGAGGFRHGENRGRIVRRIARLSNEAIHAETGSCCWCISPF